MNTTHVGWTIINVFQPSRESISWIDVPIILKPRINKRNQWVKLMGTTCTHEHHINTFTIKPIMSTYYTKLKYGQSKTNDSRKAWGILKYTLKVPKGCFEEFLTLFFLKILWGTWPKCGALPNHFSIHTLCMRGLVRGVGH